MESKALLVDYKYCTGCHACEVACNNELELPVDEWGIKIIELGPQQMQGKWMWNYLPVLSSLCNLCEDRVNEGKMPSCVHHCLAQCIELVSVDDASRAMKEKGATVACYIP